MHYSLHTQQANRVVRIWHLTVIIVLLWIDGTCTGTIVVACTVEGTAMLVSMRARVHVYTLHTVLLVLVLVVL